MSWKPISNIENIDQANKGTSKGINCLVRCASCAFFLPQLKFYDNSKMHNYHYHACIIIAVDAIDGHFCLQENTTMESLKRFGHSRVVRTCVLEIIVTKRARSYNEVVPKIVTNQINNYNMSMHNLPNKILHLHFYLKYINLQVSKDQFTPTSLSWANLSYDGHSQQNKIHLPTYPQWSIPNMKIKNPIATNT